MQGASSKGEGIVAKATSVLECRQRCRGAGSRKHLTLLLWQP